MKIAEEKGNKKLIGKSITAIGQDYADSGNYPQALKYFTRAGELWEQTGDKASLAQNYLFFPFVYTGQGNFSESSKNNFAALKIFESIGNKHACAVCRSNIADDFLNLGNLNKAIEYYKGVIPIIRETGDIINECDCFNQMGNIYKKMRNEQGPFPVIYPRLQSAREINNSSCMAGAYTGLGDVYNEQGNPDKALQNYLAGEQLYRRVSNRQELAILSSKIGAIYIHLKDFKEARKYLDEALRLSVELNSKLAITAPFKP